jgi:membrane-anchored protein YejM (alkaline phosphatase superfamily)
MTSLLVIIVLVFISCCFMAIDSKYLTSSSRSESDSSQVVSDNIIMLGYFTIFSLYIHFTIYGLYIGPLCFFIMPAFLLRMVPRLITL